MKLLLCISEIEVARDVARKAMYAGFVTDVVEDVFEACRRLERERYDAMLLEGGGSVGELRNAVGLIRELAPEVRVGVMEDRSEEAEGTAGPRGRGLEYPLVVRNADEGLMAFLGGTVRDARR